ncbi:MULTISPECIES: negative control protein of sporulation [Citrobacter]|uniref:negative control protein of sporulation n=1 Tax=Citrobacter TaxID=544 RepID=UPI001BCE2BD6|nr:MULTISPECIES: negative control protein of sporulation [Citrobacter]EKT9262211.1 negative control protein of sporulation [Citrobacter freundii]EKU4727108.1 negative control protein of sporulation [Citrobacter freundii]EKV2293421.1 negative control protein of sporulation [Citrobacter freundii]EKW0767573.1 negative control protein of sporulation [Citrobacter freundii]MDM3216487.1 negative control protein of sporulation [Citrobacter sp. Cf084]
MLNVTISLCIYNGITQTKYDVNSGFNKEETYKALKTAYIAGIRNKEQRIIAAGIFISSIEDKKDPRLANVAAAIFKSHQPTKTLADDIYSLPISKIKINLENGTLQEAFSDIETDILFTDFYMNNSIDGRA